MTNEQKAQMTDDQKLILLTGVLKLYAEETHCYDIKEDSYEYPLNKWDIFEDGSDYGEVTFARTLLEQIGENFEHPCMRNERGVEAQ